MSEVKPKILRKETYLKMIENAVDSRIFNSLIVENDSGPTDILKDGEFSCAVFVSGILYLNKMLSAQRATVDSLENDLALSEQYTEISIINYLSQSGDILIWSKTKFPDDKSHRHIGFAFNEKEAISTNYKKKCVDRHPLKYNFKNPETERKIERIFRYKF